MNEIIDALPGLGAVSLATGLIAAHRLIFGDPDANQHAGVSDYRPTLAPERRNWPLVDRQARQDHAHTYGMSCPVRGCCWPLEAGDILPPAPPGTNAGGSPLYSTLLAEQVVAEQLRKWGATPAERAHRILRELGDKAQMEASIDPVSGHAVCWDGTCELGCPACADEAVTR